MSIDSSLKIRGALSRHRNVLSRAEKIEQLVEEERWNEGDPVTGLPKVSHRKSRSGKKGDDDEKTETTEATEVAATDEAEKTS